jgi:hypothetical protein
MDAELYCESKTLPEYDLCNHALHEEEISEKALHEFVVDISVITGREHLEETREKNSFDDMAAVLKMSRYGASLLDFAESAGIKNEYSDQVQNASYLRRSGMIQVNPNLKMEEQVLLLGRELRRAWQHKNGVLLHPLTFHPDQAILVNRAQVADLTVSMVRIAWELQLGGYRDAWERVENSPMADFGRIFAREAFLDFRTLNNGAAMAAAFETWFISERCRVQDKYLIHQMLSDYQGYVFEAEECSRSVTADLIATLGEVPFGNNYLAPYAATIIMDPLFTEVRDRANANFLWFIKFEKSFRETEQELQSGSGLNSHAYPQGYPEKDKKDTEHGSSENVIYFPSDYQQEGTGEGGFKAGRNAAGIAEVIYFPRNAEF